MINLDNTLIEVNTGVLADDKKELIATFRPYSNADEMNLQLGKSLSDIIFDMFMKFNYTVEIAANGKVEKCTNLRQLASYPRCEAIADIIIACIEKLTVEITKSREIAETIEKKSKSAGKSSKLAD